MKKIYSFVFAAITSVTFAQQTISFESQEGFITGTIHNQNGWEVTEGSDGVLQNQVITNEFASDGTFSFKNAYEPEFDFQWFPIFGTAKVFDEPSDYTNFSISYDIYVTEQLGSDFEFTAFSVNDDNIFIPVAGVGIENQGQIYVIVDADYGFEILDAEWEVNQWINVKIEVDASEVRYYINNELKYSLENFSNLDITGINMLHNNYGGDAYYDNIKINEEALVTHSANNSHFSLYPNPASDYINIQAGTQAQVNDVTIYNVTGQQVLHSKQSVISVSNLTTGVYIVTITTADGKSETKKFIKN